MDHLAIAKECLIEGDGTIEENLEAIANALIALTERLDMIVAMMVRVTGHYPVDA